MMKPDEYSALIEAIWKANEKNSAKVAQDSMAAFPLPPIMASLEIMSNRQFSKLLAEVQKRSFFLGALAMAVTMDEAQKGRPQ